MVTSRATLAIVDQLGRAVVVLGMREFLERRPSAPPAEPMGNPRKPAGHPIKLLLFVTGSLVLGAWSFGSLGAVTWWLITGRGPGGRVVAAGAVAPRHYDFPARARMQRA